MRLLTLSAIVATAFAQSSTSSSSPSPAAISTTPASSTAASSAAASTASYTITALPLVTSQPSCIFNCLIPIGLADPSGCDDVTNECACLSAPADVLDYLTGCVNTVCGSSTRAYGAIATSLYEGYCQSVFGAAQFSQAFLAESSAAEASSTSAAAAAAASSASPSPSASPTSSGSEPMVWASSILVTRVFAIGGMFFLAVL